VLYPLTFEPIFKERVWGGRELERIYAKPLPPGKPIGESWEISDRPGDASVISNGPLAGKTLRWLMENHAAEILGKAIPAAEGRFPLLCKILDAREKLSLQVHPPAGRAKELHGEPKTEMWFITDAAPEASLYVGLKRGVKRAEFEKKVSDGTVADCFHRIPVRAGDAMFLPSGRVHAIGAGLVIFEIQQNSDTTYRVFDWNRVGLDGKPRELHVPQSLASIDFKDFEPGVLNAEFHGNEFVKTRQLVFDPLFSVEHWEMTPKVPKKLTDLPRNRRSPSALATPIALGGLSPFTLQLVAVLKGKLEVEDRMTTLMLSAGQFCLIPASLKSVEISATSDATLLRVVPNEAQVSI
jgi:mannose-6-phosphate isomerase